jgi:hypothetical protein
MLPLHHDPGRKTSCRCIRLVPTIASVLVTNEPSFRSGPGGAQIPSAGLQPAARPSLLPTRSVVQVMSQANSIQGQILVSTRRLASLQTWHSGRMFAHFREMIVPRFLIASAWLLAPWVVPGSDTSGSRCLRGARAGRSVDGP